MKCDEIIEKIEQADDAYRHRFVPIHLDLEIEDVLAAFYELKNELENLKVKNIELQSFYDLHGNVDNYIDKLKAENESLEEENKKLVFALSEAVQKQGFKNLNIPESLFKSMEKIAEVRGENQKYIEQLRGDVSKWHKAYDALLDERNSLAHELHNIKKTLTEGV